MLRGIVIVAAMLWLAAAPSPGVFGTGDTFVRPQGAGTLQGDVDCSEVVDSVDSLQIQRGVAGLSTNAECLDEAGDVDCDFDADATDALRILRFVASLPTLTPDCVPIGDPIEPDDPPPSGADLIATALEAGEIEYEQSLIYRAYALYGDERLPEEFVSPVPGMEDGSSLFSEVAVQQADISAETLSALAPYMARPNEALSIFSGVSTAGPNALSWWTLPAAGGRYRAWVQAASAEVATLPLNGFKEEIELVVPELAKVIGDPLPDEAGNPDPSVNPDDAIDIFYVPAGGIDPRHPYCQANPNDIGHCGFNNVYGLARPDAPMVGNKSSGYVMIDKDLHGATMLATLAHELFHVSQNAYDYQESGGGFWLMDSTAEWGAFRVLDQMNQDKMPVHQGLPYFLKRVTDTELVSGADALRYASWLYFYFLELEESSTDVVNQIWQAAAAPGAQLESAVNDVFPFTEYYPKFAEYAWNQDPHDEFILEDQIVPHAPVYGGSPEDVTLGGGTEAVEYEAPALVNWLSSHFFHYKFTDESVRSATFHNTLLDQPDAAVTAFIKVDGNWSAEDWSEMEQAFFCRDLADENIEELVVIISNTDWQNNRERLDPEDNPSLEASAVGCKGWIGDLSAEVVYNDARFTVSVTDALFVDNPIDTDPEDRYSGYILKSSGPVTWHASGEWAFHCPILSGEMPLDQPDGMLGEGTVYGTFTTDREEGDHSIFVAGHDFDATFTYQCPDGDPTEMAWPVIPVSKDGGAAQHHPITQENGQNVAESTWFDPSTSYGGTWTWRLVEVK